MVTLRALIGLLPKPTDCSAASSPLKRSSNEPIENEKAEDSQMNPISKDGSSTDCRCHVSVTNVAEERVTGNRLHGNEDYVDAYMTFRERTDFLILSLEFGVFVAG